MPRTFRTIPILIATLLLAAPALAQNGSGPAAEDPAGFTPKVNPTLEVSRAPGAIEIDGELDDAGWRGVARATGFSENFPVERGKPPVESEAWMTYDDEYLYIALVAHDDPSAIRTSIRDRDEMWSDDYFGILLDTYGDASWAYFLFANPDGVQGDSRFSSTDGEDDGFDIVYESDGKITDRGYQIEMAIPFESLRFPDREEQEWRVTFWRTHPRQSRATYTWAATERGNPCFLCQFGTVTGIRGVESGGSLEILPAVVASHVSEIDDPDDPASGLDDGEFDGEGAVNLRYAHPSGVTVEGTYNPDFSQVESDVAQIDANTTFALFFPERRPFFQEGSDLFGSYFTAVYTRQINDPQVAAKVIGRMGRTSLAYLGARDETSPILLPFQERSFLATGGKSVSNLLRARRTYGESSYVGALLTDRRFEDGNGAGTTYGIDGAHYLTDDWRLEYQALGSRTVEPDEAGPTASLGDFTFADGDHTGVFDGEEFSGWASYTSLEGTGRQWSVDLDYWVSSPTFRADNGFETRNDVRRFVGFGEWSWYPENDWFNEITVDTRYTKIRDYDGAHKDEWVNPTVELSMTRQTFVEFGPTFERETFRGVDFDGLFSWFAYVESNFSEAVRAGFFIEGGDEIARNLETPRLGDGLAWEAWGTIKPHSRVVIRPALDFARLEVDGEELFSGYVGRVRSDLSFSKRLFLRLVLQYDDFDEALDVEPLLTYKINPFTLFYVGSTQAFSRLERVEDRGEEFTETERQFFLKFQYLFQL